MNSASEKKCLGLARQRAAILLLVAIAASGPQALAQADLQNVTITAAELLLPALAPAAPVGAQFEIAPDSYERVKNARRLQLTNVDLTGAGQVDLDLERFYASALGAQFVIGTEDGDVRVPEPALATFRGSAIGHPGSWAVIGVTPTKIYGVIHLGPQQEFWLAPPPLALAGMPHAIYERFAAAQHFGPPTFRCEPDIDPAAQPPPQQEEGGIAGGYTWRVVELALDGDYQFRQLFSSNQEALEYMALLVAVISTIYEDDMHLRISIVYARVWNTSSDPYTANNTSDALNEMRDYWNDNMGSVPRHIAHLLSGRDLGGGRASLAALCDDRSYGVNSVLGSFPYPVMNQNADNWDIFVLAHEMGHNFGSPHTHCYSPPIDTCAGMGFDCPNAQVCQVGTIMSYCHLCAGGIGNINLNFGSRVIATMRGFIDDECPRIARNPCCVDHANSGDESGTSSEPYNTVTEGMQYVIPGGLVQIRPGAYPEVFTGWKLLNRPMRLERWGSSGVVRIGAP